MYFGQSVPPPSENVLERGDGVARPPTTRRHSVWTSPTGHTYTTYPGQKTLIASIGAGGVGESMPADGGDADVVPGATLPKRVSTSPRSGTSCSAKAPSVRSLVEGAARSHRRAGARGADGAGPTARAERTAEGAPGVAALGSDSREIASVHLRGLLARDPARGERFAVEAEGLYLDYSKNRVTDETLRLLRGFRDRRTAPARSTPCSAASASTSRRTVPSCTSRCACPEDSRYWSTGSTSSSRCMRSSMRARLQRRVRSANGRATRTSRSATSSTSASAGSDLGPVMAYEALRHYARRDLHLPLRLRDVDSTDSVEATRDLEPDETLFIVSSKTFGTLETMTVALGAAAGHREASAAKRSIASTSSRFRRTPTSSASSASTPPTCSSSRIGSAAVLDGLGDRAVDDARHRRRRVFDEMLAGFHALDEHFRHGAVRNGTCRC